MAGTAPGSAALLVLQWKKSEKGDKIERAFSHDLGYFKLPESRVKLPLLSQLLSKIAM